MPPTQAIRAGRAFVELHADDNKLVRTLKRGEARLRAFGQSVSNMGQSLLKASAAIVAPAAAMVKSFLDQGDALDKMTGRTGVAVETLSNPAYVADTNGAHRRPASSAAADPRTRRVRPWRLAKVFLDAKRRWVRPARAGVGLCEHQPLASAGAILQCAPDVQPAGIVALRE